MRILLLATAVLAGLYLLAVLAMFGLQRQLLFDPSNRAPTPAEAGFDAATEVILVASDGTRIKLWHAPAAKGQPTILFFHGKGGEIADRPKRWAACRAAGLGVAFLSYRGFGGSDGHPSEAGLLQDAAAAHDWLVSNGVKSQQIALVGESLGTGVAVGLAAQKPVGALILEAPYTSVVDVAAKRYPWLPVRWLMLDRFESLELIGDISVPLLVLHGTADTRIPPEMGVAMHAAAPGPKELILVPDTGHVELFNVPTWAQEIAFIDRVIKPISP